MTLPLALGTSSAHRLTAKRLLASTSCPRRFSTAQNEPHEECDVVIVGGGPAGLTLASALGSSRIASQNLRVTLVEGGDLSKVKQWSPPSGTYSNRVSSLTNASQTFLKAIGAWTHVDTHRTAPIEEMQVWDGVSDARITFSASEIGLERPQDGMARLTENFNLQRGLLRHLEHLPGVRLIERTKVKSIIRDAEDQGGWPLVHLDNGRVLRARLLVGADGFNSPVRSYAQIPSFGWTYETQGIVATMVHPPRGPFQGPNTTAYQRFLPTGPIAFLPLSPTVSSLVWSTRPRIASALTAFEPGVLASMINAAFRLPEISLRYLYNRIIEAHSTGTPLTHAELQQEILWREQSHAIDANSAYASAIVNVIGDAGVPAADSESVPPLVTSLQPGTVATFPLRFSHTESYIGEGQGSRTVLVGDAAHIVHPLAGQGLNMGLADVECLTRCIENALEQGGDVGSYTALLPYARERYFENHTLMAAIDKVHKLYTTTFEPIVWTRTVGVEVLNELDSVKTALMMTAGARDHKINESAVGWNLAAKGVESLAAGVNAARVVGGGIREMIGTGLQEVLKATSARPRSERD
ncbi:putative FAD-dependent monooxygenase required for the C5-ring hydroxylation during ubiquinone biosynthesis [Lyophyllum shimeji]|uniref:Ubiquinone biosynthesis monooxygenase COQ6, mitochondrial n=1 Tax=Lyophyllum shimeji TaxID=47721 RepID=A0A9P3UT32_LYOSH|nr:putative FAD-dependent monooxygenase required for the C5-ring hydroxylation during ubiquinone biosynthesis [Lyophyllum shimeji]